MNIKDALVASLKDAAAAHHKLHEDIRSSPNHSWEEWYAEHILSNNDTLFFSLDSYDSGYGAGYKDGYGNGYENGYDDGYKDGYKGQTK